MLPDMIRSSLSEVLSGIQALHKEDQEAKKKAKQWRRSARPLGTGQEAKKLKAKQKETRRPTHPPTGRRRLPCCGLYEER